MHSVSSSVSGQIFDKAILEIHVPSEGTISTHSHFIWSRQYIRDRSKLQLKAREKAAHIEARCFHSLTGWEWSNCWSRGKGRTREGEEISALTHRKRDREKDEYANKKGKGREDGNWDLIGISITRRTERGRDKAREEETGEDWVTQCNSRLCLPFQI